MKNQNRAKKNAQETPRHKEQSPAKDIRSEGPKNANNEGDLARYIKDADMISVLNKKGITRLFPIQY